MLGRQIKEDVVQPAILEDQPRQLLAAIAAGCPVVATEACGVSGLPGVTIVPPSSPTFLAEAIERAMKV